MRLVSSTNALLPIETEMLSALRGGETAKKFAERHSYSPSWAKWKLRKIRDKLGVTTTAEALAMSEITRADLDALQRNFNDALDKLAKALTPAQEESARRDVKDAGTDLNTELRLRGLTLKDLDAASERKQQEKIDAAIEARLKQRDDEAEAKRKADEEAAKLALENGEGGGGMLDKIRDGLGGKTWTT